MDIIKPPQKQCCLIIKLNELSYKNNVKENMLIHIS